MKTKGFTLIELMIVVAIIAIIAAIAIPNLLRSRLAANESSAIGSLRTINSAQATYQQSGLKVSSGVGQYGEFTELADAANQPQFLDSTFDAANPNKSGYSFAMTLTGDIAGTGYQTTAGPLQYERTGVRSFFTDDSGVIRFTTDDADADSDSDPLT